MKDVKTKSHVFFMSRALALAKQAEKQNEVPVGAVVVYNDEIIGSGYNCPIGRHDPTAHAEIMAIREAARHTGNYRLTGCDLYVTVEPCVMCAGAIIHSRIKSLCYGAGEPKAGAITSRFSLLSSNFFNHQVKIESGILEDECRDIIQVFFQKRRSEKKRMAD